MSLAACANWSNIFISGQMHAPPFRMSIKIAHPLLSMLQFSLLHFIRLRRVEDAGYRRRVDFIKTRSATVNLRTVWDIHRFNVDAISIELERRGTDPGEHCATSALAASGSGRLGLRGRGPPGRRSSAS